MFETVRYTYRLRPGGTAERALICEWHRCRFLWNEAVHQEKSGHKPTLAKLGKLLTEASRRCRWLREGSQVAQQQTLRTYARALDDSFTVVWSRELPSEPTSVRVYQDTLGDWCASLVVRRESDPLPATDGGTVVENHQLVAVEDFHPEFLAKTTMARKAADAAVGATKRVLVEYGVRAGRNTARVILAVAERGHTRIVDVRHWYPSSGTDSGAL